MPVTKVLARDWMLEIEDDNGTEPEWVEVKGLTSLSFGGDKTDADTTDFDSEGRAEHLPVRRERNLTIEGNYLEDPDTGDRDEGQDLVDDAAELVGQDALKEFRLTSPGGTEKEFTASVEPADVGGGVDDTTDWGADLTISGQVE